MRSKLTFCPVGRYWKKMKKEIGTRIYYDSLDAGLWNLPPVDTLPKAQVYRGLTMGVNCYHGSISANADVTIPKLLKHVCLLPTKFLIEDINIDKYLYKDFVLDHNIFDEKYGAANIVKKDIRFDTKYLIESIDIKSDIQKYINNNDDILYFIFPNDGGKFGEVGIIKKIGNKLSCEVRKKVDFLKTKYRNILREFNTKYTLLRCRNIYPNDKIIPTKEHKIRITVKTASLLEADNLRAQLPKLPQVYAQDKALGLWDAYWPKGVEPDWDYYVLADLDKECEAADPWEAVQHGAAVCIDFGTSSTVAAVRESDGSTRLLRIGSGLDNEDGEGRDEAQDPFENPTALEFANFSALLSPWKNEPWRPETQWKDVKFSHLARNELKQGERAQNGIRNIKTWARGLPGTFPLRVSDEKGAAFEFSPLPVEELDGLGDIRQRPVDPIELYAYFLGLACNNQSAFGGRIYCDYAMTFPVKFPQEVRRRIRQGFYRGLLRSMPCSLACSPRWKEKPLFRLEERASEPTAFAASVLPYLGIKPTEGGVPFGVFDFGGGTTDFAFGLYRKPTAEEKGANNWSRVLDILDVSGDENLGGEHLLELMAYELFHGEPKNCQTCLKADVAVTLPPSRQVFDGSELLFTNDTREARANTVTLCEMLRPLWEKGCLADDDTGLLEANLQDREGKSVKISLKVDADKLRACLKARINKGVSAFFTAFAQAFKMNGIRPQQLHVLLAGNSCRSPLVRECFEENLKTVVPTERKTVTIHYEMLPGGKRDAALRQGAGEIAPDGSIPPTLKTGVALGLLRLLRGESTGVVERNRKEESPFLFTVGTFEEDRLVPVIQRNAMYGEWVRADKVYREGVSILGYSASPLAMEKGMSRAECRPLRFDWGEENFGKSVFLKASGPREIVAAIGEESADTPDVSTAQTRTLTN